MCCPLAPALCSDPVDLVRFGAIEAMAGALASPASSSLTAAKAASAREDTVQRQRRARAWRLLVAQAGVEVRGGPAAGRSVALLVDCGPLRGQAPQCRYASKLASQHHPWSHAVNQSDSPAAALPVVHVPGHGAWRHRQGWHEAGRCAGPPAAAGPAQDGQRGALLRGIGSSRFAGRCAFC